MTPAKRALDLLLVLLAGLLLALPLLLASARRS